VIAARIVPAGDAAFVIEFDDRIDPVINARAVALAEAIDADHTPGVRDVVPTHRSVAVYFDPLQTDQRALVEKLERLAERPAQTSAPRRDPIRIPVCYGGDGGPDLPRIAAFAGLSEAAVVDLHATTPYRVLMLGFMPGFAYMGLVDARIAVPRLETPRTRVPIGSVAIAGVQTGIHPREAPSGWHLIGRTPVRPFDLSRADPFLFRSGDDVRFFPIAQEEFDDLDRAR
jgi:inhibitor of KinA